MSYIFFILLDKTFIVIDNINMGLFDIRKAGDIMKVQSAVRTETVRIAMGTACLSLIMLLVFALLGRLDVTVVLGTLWGAGAAVLNFFLMALSVQRAAESMNGVAVPPESLDENDDPDSGAPSRLPLPEVQRAKHRMQLSYTGRMLLLVAVAIVALTAPCFHPVAAALALLFPRLVIFIQGFVKPKNKEA